MTSNMHEISPPSFGARMVHVVWWERPGNGQQTEKRENANETSPSDPEATTISAFFTPSPASPHLFPYLSTLSQRFGRKKEVAHIEIYKNCPWVTSYHFRGTAHPSRSQRSSTSCIRHAAASSIAGCGKPNAFSSLFKSW